MNKLECKTVRQLSAINFEGNIIPHHWYSQLKTDAGHTDLNAITLLAEIVFLHRPIQLTDRKGKPLLKQRFRGQTLNIQVAYFVEKFGLSDNQARDALKRLETKHGLISREYKTALEDGKRVSNVMFITLNIKQLKAITHPDLEETEEEDEPPPPPASKEPKAEAAKRSRTTAPEGGLKAALKNASASMKANKAPQASTPAYTPTISPEEFERRRQAQLKALKERQQIRDRDPNTVDWVEQQLGKQSHEKTPHASP